MSPPPSCESCSPQERRALRSLWQTKGSRADANTNKAHTIPRMQHVDQVNQHSEGQLDRGIERSTNVIVIEPYNSWPKTGGTAFGHDSEAILITTQPNINMEYDL
jgi:hypothetical protein